MQIIAEIGSNFESFEECWNGVIEAAAAKATAVKFQYFSHNDLYGFGSTETKFKREWLAALSKLAHKHNLKFGVTAFSQEGVDIVSPYVDFYKIASAENLLRLNFPRQIPKIVSTGGLTLDEIPVMAQLQELKKGDCVMYCVAAYPAAYEDYSLANLCSLHRILEETGIESGLSDHTADGRFASEAAMITSITWLEKHFRPMATKEDSSDYPHSIPRRMFGNMVDDILGVRSGQLSYYIPQAEVDFRERHQRRYIEIDGHAKFVRPK